ncbi:carboxypeptidase regulatory-like domain-containing protein [Alloacidobacterium dinghuense]|uniref:Carboxypeptidase regulatory-like domain-containing protein n=1 Tax=Alloacidobacterium dinghuense TaxID=2763107 RepID=A0A7G8BF01_9BACT|nr:carboxypeptidase regulatory-like domain-containing protein [Alloacidobacterium dinghuense]
MVYVGRALAQTQSGINGTITDSSGATLDGAQVAVRNLATGVVTQETTNSAGSYNIPSLVPGTYTVTITKTGFQSAVERGVIVATGQTASVNLVLGVGEVNTQVEVTSSAISLQMQTPQVGVTIENKVVQELPDQINGQGRQIDDFIFLAPGVTGSEFSHRISGGQDFQDEVLFQGIPAVQSETEGYQSYINPPFEMVNEFHVASDVFSTQYGLGQGAVSYNFVSGTNKLHGDAFEINRNNYFDARGLVQINPQVPVDKQNNYGFSLGGPVWIPHVYNGRNRTFWHASSEWFKWNQQPSTTMTVPTALAKQGNFSGYAPIYVPAGLHCAGLTPGQQFPGNIIPQSCFSALSSSLLNQIPDPTLPGLTNNINSQLGVVQTTQTSWGFTIDHNFNQQHSIHYSQWRDSHNSPAVDNNAYFSNELSGLKTEPRLGSGFFLNYTGSISNNLVVTAGFGWTGEINNELNAHQNVNFPGVQQGTTLPTISFSGLAPDAPTTWGANTNGEVSSINRKLGLAFANNYLYLHGRNTFNFGFEARRAYQDDHECNSCTGGFAFSSLTTSNGITDQGAGLNENTTGNAFASFLLGQVDSSFRQQAFESRLRNFSISPYIMDDIKINPKLTISAGLRWDILVPYTADQPGNITFLDVTKPNPGAIGPNGPLLGAATALGNGPGAAGFSRADIPWTNVGPRLGFSYAVNSKTVLNGGYSVIFLDGGAYEFGTNKVANDYGNILAGINQTPSSGTNLAAYGSWDARTLLNPPATPLTATISNGSGVLHAFQRSGIRQPYSQMFNLGLQRELPWNLFMSASYVGNHGVHLVSALNPTNQLDPRYLSLGQALLQPWNSAAGQAALHSVGVAQINGLYQPYANFSNDFPGQTVQQALLEYPQFLGTENGNTLNNFDTNGVSIYNALQAQLQKRFSDGLSFLLSYTYSRTMSNADTGFSIFTPNALNKFNQRAEWAVSSGDQPHVLVLSGVYELPFGAGKPFFSGGNRFLSKQVIGGWQLSGTFQYDSGTPFGISASGTPLATGGNRANDVAGAPISLNYKNYYNGTPVLNTGAFSDPGRTAVGSAARNQSDLRNPFQSVENLALAKKFQFGEGVQAELRMEYFNVLNRMQVCGPSDSNVSDLRTASNPNANFGYVVGPCQGNSPRQGQAYFRINF